jgi:hypothetical protein
MTGFKAIAQAQPSETKFVEGIRVNLGSPPGFRPMRVERPIG